MKQNLCPDYHYYTTDGEMIEQDKVVHAPGKREAPLPHHINKRAVADCSIDNSSKYNRLYLLYVIFHYIQVAISNP